MGQPETQTILYFVSRDFQISHSAHFVSAKVVWRWFPQFPTAEGHLQSARFHCTVVSYHLWEKLSLQIFRVQFDFECCRLQVSCSCDKTKRILWKLPENSNRVKVCLRRFNCRIRRGFSSLNQPLLGDISSQTPFGSSIALTLSRSHCIASRPWQSYWMGPSPQSNVDRQDHATTSIMATVAVKVSIAF